MRNKCGNRVELKNKKNDHMEFNDSIRQASPCSQESAKSNRDGADGIRRNNADLSDNCSDATWWCQVIKRV